MRRKKRNLEKVEAVATASTMNDPPFLMTKDEVKFCYSLLANRQPQNSERIMSEAKRDLIIMLDRIADRWKNAPPPPVPPLALDKSCPGSDMNTASAKRADEPDIPLHQLIKQTKLLLAKASRK